MSFAISRTGLTLAAVGLSLAILHPALAYDTSLYGKPIYDPDTKSYFELVDIRDRANPNSDGVTWVVASGMASKMVWGGVQGRLAIVKDIKTHEFLLHNFHPSVQTWIGLKYLCRQRQLQWSDGTDWTSGSFQAWDPNWKQDIYFCSDPNGFGSIAYLAIPEFRWIGKGSDKHFPAAFVEFPTGQP